MLVLYQINTTLTVVYILMIFIALFCHGTSLKKIHLATWGRQSTDMLASGPSGIPNALWLL